MSYRQPQSAKGAGAYSSKPKLVDSSNTYCPGDRDSMMRTPDAGSSKVRGGGGGGYNDDRLTNNVLDEICADIGPQDVMEWDLFDAFPEPYPSYSFWPPPSSVVMEEGDSYDQPIAFSDKEAKVEQSFVQRNQSMMSSDKNSGYQRPPFFWQGSAGVPDFSSLPFGTHANRSVDLEQKTNDSATSTSFAQFSMKLQTAVDGLTDKAPSSVKCELIGDSDAATTKEQQQTVVSRPSASARRSPAGTKHGAATSVDAVMEDGSNSTDDMKHQQHMSGSNPSDASVQGKLDSSVAATEVNAKRARVISTASDLLEEVRSQYSFVKGAEVFTKSSSSSAGNGKLNSSSISESSTSKLDDSAADNKASTKQDEGAAEKSPDKDEDCNKAIVSTGNDESPTFAQSFKGLNDMYDKYGLRPKAAPLPTGSNIGGNSAAQSNSCAPSFGGRLSSNVSPGSRGEGSHANDGQVNYRQLYMQKIMMRQNLMQRGSSMPSMGMTPVANVNVDANCHHYHHAGSVNQQNIRKNHNNNCRDDCSHCEMSSHCCCSCSSMANTSHQHHCQCQQNQRHGSFTMPGLAYADDAKPHWMQPCSSRGRLGSVPDNVSRYSNYEHQHQQQLSHGGYSSHSCNCSQHSSRDCGHCYNPSFDINLSKQQPSRVNNTYGCEPGSRYARLDSGGFYRESQQLPSQLNRVAPMIMGNATEYMKSPTGFEPQLMVAGSNDSKHSLLSACGQSMVSPRFRALSDVAGWRDEQQLPQQQAYEQYRGSFTEQSLPQLSPHSQREPSTALASFQTSIIHQIVMDGSSAFCSHPLFPLLRDLTIADMNFDSPSFPFQLIASLPADFNRLLQNFVSRNPATAAAGYRTNNSVDRVIMDALKHAHSALIGECTDE